MSTALLRRLERWKSRYGGGAGRRKRELLRRLETARLRSAGAVERLHEVLCFLRAYPDDAALLARVERMLRRFERRADLRRHAGALKDSGIAGTVIHYPFFAEMANWLTTRWPRGLAVDWDELEQPEQLERVLHLLALYAETPALDELALPVEEWVDRLKGPGETDAAFLVRRFQRLRIEDPVRESLYESLDLTLRLEPGPGTPSRTHAHVPRGPVAYQTRPLRRDRPDLCAELRLSSRPVEELSPKEGRRLVELARAAMVTRSRDLDAFSYGDPRDVRIVDFGEGLQLAAIGLLPERRLLLEAVYGFLTLKNGVPIGYVLNSALFGSAEMAYNVFDTYRGAEAAFIYGRLLGAVHQLFGARSFTVYPYQLGHDNEEGLQSGAWWFYQKVGFRPRDRATLRLMRTELARMKRSPRHRSSLETLKTLASENVYLHCEPARDDVIGILSLSNVGLAIVDGLARRFGSERERGEEVLALEAAERLGLASLKDLSASERQAWRRWAPLVAVLPGLDRWTAPEREALARVVIAKGGRRESDYVRAVDAHLRLRAAVRRLAERPPARSRGA
jgi:hypothetical protein